MRHTLFTMLAVCSLSGAYAQKNSILLFGNVGGSNQSSSGYGSESAVSTFLVNSGVGYQVSDHVTAGLQGGYGRFKSQNGMSGNPSQFSTNSEFGVGAFCRYTQYLGDRVFVYLQGAAGYNQTQRASSNSVSNKQGYLGAEFMPAIGCFIYRGWALNLNIGEVEYRYHNNDGIKTGLLTYNLGQSVQIGFSKNFIRKAKVQPQG